MTRQPKTPRTKRQKWLASLRDWDFIEQGIICAKSYRRLPKGRRAKSGQWWRRPDARLTFAEIVNEAWPQPPRRVVDIDSGFVVIDEHHDSRSETHDEVDTDTGRGSIWIPKEQA